MFAHSYTPLFPIDGMNWVYLSKLLARKRKTYLKGWKKTPFTERHLCIYVSVRSSYNAFGTDELHVSLDEHA